MKKLLLLFSSLIVIGTSFALNSKDEALVDHVIDVLEDRIAEGVKTRNEYITVLDTIITGYPQYAEIFSAIRSGIILPVEDSRMSSGGDLCIDHTWITGPRGGCYYWNSNGNKTYDTDKACCMTNK